MNLNIKARLNRLYSSWLLFLLLQEKGGGGGARGGNQEAKLYACRANQHYHGTQKNNKKSPTNELLYFPDPPLFTAVMFKEDSPFPRNCIHNLQNTLLSRLLLKLEKLSEQGSEVQFPAVSEAG